MDKDRLFRSARGAAFAVQLFGAAAIAWCLRTWLHLAFWRVPSGCGTVTNGEVATAAVLLAGHGVWRLWRWWRHGDDPAAARL